MCSCLFSRTTAGYVASNIKTVIHKCFIYNKSILRRLLLPLQKS